LAATAAVVVVPKVWCKFDMMSIRFFANLRLGARV
jgi:hypothetical protein